MDFACFTHFVAVCRKIGSQVRSCFEFDTIKTKPVFIILKHDPPIVLKHRTTSVYISHILVAQRI